MGDPRSGTLQALAILYRLAGLTKIMGDQTSKAR